MFGALAPMSDVAADPRLVRDYPALSESLWRAASQQLRNMATFGGNLLQRTRCAYFRGGEPYACNKRTPGSGCAAIGGLDRGHAVLGGSTSCIAVYPGDWSVALVAFDAQVDTLSPRGERTIALESLHREPGDTPHIETTLAPDELIVRIRVPATPLGRASTYHKIRDRESYAFALASAAVALDMDGETVREARVALGGVATRPWRARSAERALVGRSLNAATARAAGDEAFVGARRRAGQRVQDRARRAHRRRRLDDREREGDGHDHTGELPRRRPRRRARQGARRHRVRRRPPPGRISRTRCWPSRRSGEGRSSRSTSKTRGPSTALGSC